MARYGKHLHKLSSWWVLIGTCPLEAVPQDGCAGDRSWQIPRGCGQRLAPQHPCPGAEPLRARQRGPVPWSAAVYGTAGMRCGEP